MRWKNEFPETTPYISFKYRGSNLTYGIYQEENTELSLPGRFFIGHRAKLTTVQGQQEQQFFVS